MSTKSGRQPFLAITLFALLLMGVLLFVQTRSDNSIRDMQYGNAMSSITFRANDSLQEIINDISIIETSIRNDLAAGKIIQRKGISDTIESMGNEVNNIRSFTASKDNKNYIDALAGYVKQKTLLYKKITENPEKIAEAKALLNSESNNVLNNNIYLAAQNIQLQLENNLQQAIQKNTVVSAEVLKLSRVLTILSLVAILLLVTLILRHLYRNVKLIRDLEKEKHKTQEAANIKEQFLANMSHEIRTPVNAITGFTNLLGKTELNEQQESFVNLIKTASINLHTIVSDILDISKIEAGMSLIHRSFFDVHELIKEKEMLFVHQANQKDIKLTCKISDDVPQKLTGDVEKLNQVLMNLLSNAIKFTSSGTISIDVSLKEKTGKIAVVVFKVKDSGIGIPAHKQETIFERFEQADSETTRNYGGTGLGLAIVKKLITMQDGTIVLNSGENKGSEFVVTIPFETETNKSKIDEADQMVSIPAKQNIYFSSSLKVLAAEDNKMNQLLLVHLFKQWHLNLTIAANGKEAISFLKENKFDLIFMDIQMPEMDGYTATAVIREALQPSVPIVAMTAHAMPGERERCLAAGMNDYLPKPIIENDLITILNKYLSTQEQNFTADSDFVDVAEMRATFGNNEAFVKNILTLFLEQFPKEITAFENAFKERNIVNIKAIAHSLKTTVTAVNSASPLTALLDAIETENEHAEITAEMKLHVEQIIQSSSLVIKQAEEKLLSAAN
jgi:signal transduction histidine kinase/DNA-binding response OmpR family regulator